MSLFIISYFDWEGSREGLMGWVETMRGQCDKHGVDFMGLYGPSQVKFNWAMVFRADSQDHHAKTWREIPIPAEVTHMVLHYLWPEETFMRELPRYPPPRFFEPE